MEFRVGSFNLRNLVLPNFRFYEDLIYSDGEYQQKIHWCSQQLQNMNAQIVSFQEVFHAAPLKELCVQSGLYGDSPYIICPSCDGTEPRVALVSTFPIIEWKEHTELPQSCQTEEFISFRRPFIEAVIEIPVENSTQLLRVFSVHLKSKRPLLIDEDPLDVEGVCTGLARSLRLRAQEAIGLRHLIQKRIDLPTIVMGDFNDTAGSVTSQIIRGPHLHSDHPEEIIQKFTQSRLDNTHDIARRRSSQDMHYTYVFNGHYETVDHIFISNHFRYPKGKLIHYQTYTDHLLDRKSASQPVHTSDHGQVVATLALCAQGEDTQ